ncbi:MAG: ABC transporter permease [Caulobacterales bacterium]
MFFSVARFEAGYQLRNPVLWVSFGIFFLLTFGATTIDQIQIGDSANVHVNSPYAIAQVILVMAIFALFAITAFVANAVTRDDETGYGPILRATRLDKTSYLYGRCAGAFLAAAIGFLAAPLAILVGSFMPWLDAEKVGPTVLWHYAYAVIGLPMLAIFAAMVFALATATRSMMAAYVGLVAIIVGWVVSGILLNRPEQETLSALIDPTGAGAMFQQTKYWTAAERNSRMLEITGLFLQNRAIWGSGAALSLFAAWFAFRPASKGAKATKAAKPSEARAAPSALSAPKLTPALNGGARAAQLWARTAFDVKR